VKLLATSLQQAEAASFVQLRTIRGSSLFITS
jgi:hypothetical protein